MDGGNWKEMFNAACTGDVELVRYHLGRGVDANYAHPEFLSTPLVASILAQQEASALALLAHGADPTLYSEFDGMTPMQAAASVGLGAVVSRLVAMGVPPEQMADAAQTSWWSRVLVRLRPKAASQNTGGGAA